MDFTKTGHPLLVNGLNVQGNLQSQRIDLMLLDDFYLLYRDRKKGLANSLLYQFCSTDLQFLQVIDWLLIGVNKE